MKYHLTKASTNVKTGPMPVATISKDSCPDVCPLKGAGCYAEGGPLNIHWVRVTKGETGVSFPEFLNQVRALPNGIWRYGQAGDLPGVSDEIDVDMLMQLAQANRGRPVIAFTHKPRTAANSEAIRRAKEAGFHINISTETLEAADAAIDDGHSAVVVLPMEYGRLVDRRTKTYSESLSQYRERVASLPRHSPGGRKIAVCPATYTETTCQKCGVCASARNKDAIVGFPAHGVKSRLVTRKIHEARSDHVVPERRAAEDDRGAHAGALLGA